MYRILHVGLGPLGQKIIHDLYDRRLGRVVAAVDVDPRFSGQAVRDIVRSVDGDVRVMDSLDDFAAWDSIDAALVTTSSDLRLCAETFRRLLSRGVTVVSTCEELVWPWLRHAALAQELDEIAQRGKGRLLGTGVNPGAMMDMIPVFTTSVCRSVKSVEVHRIQDATTRRIPFQRKIGATLDDKAFNQGVRDGWLRHVGLGESLHFVANYLGFKIDEWHESIEPVRAEKPMTCGLGAIAKGAAAGVRQVAVGRQHGKALITMVFQAAIGQADPQDRVIVDGEPLLDVVFRGGVHGDIATSAMTLNSIGPLTAARPGLHTMATIPLVHFAPARG
ncbi:MAG: dihydrodipicolinate reductase [Phycisphaerales bacterium]